MTVCCAGSPDGGLLHYQVIQGGMKKEFFANFLQVLCGNLILNEGPDPDGVCSLITPQGMQEMKKRTLMEFFSSTDSLGTAPFSQWLRMRFLVGKLP